MNINKIILAVFVAITIPIVLNYILPIETGLKIIGGNKSNIVWLEFWGAYLAALGSFVLGWISYVINRNAIKQNEKILYNVNLEHLMIRYDHLAKFIANAEIHHNDSYIKKVDKFVEECKSDNDKLIYLYKQKQRISLTSLNIIRFIEQEYANEYHNETGRALYKYGKELADANIAINEFIGDYIKALEGKEYNPSDFENFIIDKDCKIKAAIKKCAGLLDCATEVIQTEKKRIREYAKKHHLEFGIL